MPGLTDQAESDNKEAPSLKNKTQGITLSCTCKWQSTDYDPCDYGWCNKSFRQQINHGPITPKHKEDTTIQQVIIRSCTSLDNDNFKKKKEFKITTNRKFHKDIQIIFLGTLLLIDRRACMFSDENNTNKRPIGHIFYPQNVLIS